MAFNKESVRIVIFEAHTPAGRAFDVGLILCILVSVAAVLLDSVADIHERHGDLLYKVEWGFTILFTIEYALRLWCIENTGRYARSFYGIVDLVGILPTYLSLLLVGTQYLLVVRILRVLRVFRVLRMVRSATSDRRPQSQPAENHRVHLHGAGADGDIWFVHVPDRG
jgi:voltage-gated potassium channel